MSLRRILALAALFVLLGCQEKTGVSAPPPPNKAQADLQAFFDGMLVPAPAIFVHESQWPLEGMEHLTDSLLPSLKRYRVGSREELRRAIDGNVEKITRPEARILRLMHDWPTLEEVWARALKEDPDDLEAAIELAHLQHTVRGPRVALASIAKTSSRTARAPPGRNVAPAELEAIRCQLLLSLGRLDEAQRACELAAELNPMHGARTSVKVLLARGRAKEALARAESLMHGFRKNDPRLWHTLGLAQQAGGQPDAAVRTWSVALARWPRHPLLEKARSGRPRSVIDWENEEEASLVKPFRARQLAECGHFYFELGMEARGNACYRQSETLMPGPALAHQLVFQGATAPAEALARASAAVKSNPHPDLMSAMAWLLLRTGKLADARSWARRALDEEPTHQQATSLTWQICGEQKDYLCVIEHRKRLGLATHFNQVQYRDARKAFEEQQRVEGTGLAAPEPPTPAKVARISPGEVTIVPLGPRTPPELGDVREILAQSLPGARLVLSPPRPLPLAHEWLSTWEVSGPELLQQLPANPGHVYVVEQDLRASPSEHAFAMHDLERGRAVISVSRFRSYGGASMAPETKLEGGALVVAQERLRGQLFATIARLLGLGAPCDSSACALRERRTVAAFSAGPTSLCPRHQQELDAILGSGSGGKPK